MTRVRPLPGLDWRGVCVLVESYRVGLLSGVMQ